MYFGTKRPTFSLEHIVCGKCVDYPLQLKLLFSLPYFLALWPESFRLADFKSVYAEQKDGALKTLGQTSLEAWKRDMRAF